MSRAADELAFVPSQLGRQLTERRYAANGIALPDLSGPYCAEVVSGFEAVAAELGRSTMILSTHGREGAPALVGDLAARCDALVVLRRAVADDVLERMATRRRPFYDELGDLPAVQESCNAGELASDPQQQVFGQQLEGAVGAPAGPGPHPDMSPPVAVVPRPGGAWDLPVGRRHMFVTVARILRMPSHRPAPST